jgi:selenocysteine lyase/cysteine desulfurase
MIYLNNAGTSWPKAPGVRAAMVAALAAAPTDFEAVFSRAHQRAGSFLGLAHAQRLLFSPGCTSALGVAVADLPWRAGDVIVTSALEHHALARPVEKLARDLGVRHEMSPYAAGRPLDLQWLREVLGRGDVRLVAMASASNLTGELLPVEEAAKLAREHGALMLVDAAQTAGILPLDLSEAAVDLVACAGHKGLLGPQGIGLLWAAPEVHFESPWATCELRQPTEASRPDCSAFPSYCDLGSVNLAGAAGLAASLQWLEERGPARAWVGPRACARRLVEELAERPGVQVLGSPTAPRTATVALTLEALPLQRAESFFAQRGIVVRAGSHCAPWALQALRVPEGCLRISFGPFNEPADVDAVLAVIDEARTGRSG